MKRIKKNRLLLTLILLLFFTFSNILYAIPVKINYQNNHSKTYVYALSLKSRSKSSGFKSGSFKSSTKKTTPKSSSSGYGSSKFSTTPKGSSSTKSSSNYYNSSSRSHTTIIPIPFFGGGHSIWRGGYGYSAFDFLGDMIKLIIIIAIIIAVIRFIKKNRR